jgi:hypothetical protein
MSSAVSCLSDYLVNLSEFEGRSMICESNQVWTEIYDLFEDIFSAVIQELSDASLVRLALFFPSNPTNCRD